MFKGGAFSEDRKLITDGAAGYIETRIVYDENGKAILFYSGVAEGFLLYSLHPKKWDLPFEERFYNYTCKINENYIIDTANPKPGRFEYGHGIDFITDTIRDFVIIPKYKIILSKDDYELLQKAKKGYEMDFKRYILYRYE